MIFTEINQSLENINSGYTLINTLGKTTDFNALRNDLYFCLYNSSISIELFNSVTYSLSHLGKLNFLDYFKNILF